MNRRSEHRCRHRGGRIVAAALLGISLSAFFLPSPVAAAEAETLRNAAGKPIRFAGNLQAAPVRIPSYVPRTREFRGVWVATVENIDFAAHADADSFKRDYLQLVDNLARMHFNAVIFQLRPMCDAFYPSAHAPWSRWLTGSEGTPLRSRAPFDPLDFMVREAHRRGLEFHAWLNPYRVVGSTKLSKSEYLARLHPRNFARRRPDLVLAIPIGGGKNNLVLNPGEQAVIRHIAAVVQEIVGRYPVDAIHFDDYFYPFAPIGNADQAAWNKYTPKRLSITDWRRENVTTAIRTVSSVIRRENAATGRRVRFGVSPFGIWANRSSSPVGSLTGGRESRNDQYADTLLWVRQGYIDYIVPQLYWEFNHGTAAYAALTSWWSNAVRGTQVELYIGHALYRIGSSPDWHSMEVPNQLRYDQLYPEIKGEVLYSYHHLFDRRNKAKAGSIDIILHRFWRNPAKVR